MRTKPFFDTNRKRNEFDLTGSWRLEVIEAVAMWRLSNDFDILRYINTIVSISIWPFQFSADMTEKNNNKRLLLQLWINPILKILLHNNQIFLLILHCVKKWSDMSKYNSCVCVCVRVDLIRSDLCFLMRMMVGCDCCSVGRSCIIASSELNAKYFTKEDDRKQQSSQCDQWHQISNRWFKVQPP